MRKFHTIVGMVSSGKTTFLAALWHLITSGELDPVLTLDHLDGDNQYLDKIVEIWQKCERLPRTSRAEDNAIAIHLRSVETDQLITLDFADLSGELLFEQFAFRRCSLKYVERLNGDGGLLLFVNADRPINAVTILDARGLLEGEEGQPTDWEPKFVSEQAQLVDLLQCMQRDPFRPMKRRLAVVISAWDVVTDETMTPERWLATEMPLLTQFLKSNTESFETEVFGVSAQGGVITEDTRRDLLNKVPSRRIRCVVGRLASSDITLPLKWLSEVVNG